VDYAHKKLEGGLEQIYHPVRRPFEGLYLNWQLHRMVYRLISYPFNLKYRRLYTHIIGH